jgi:hypothetical protein
MYFNEAILDEGTKPSIVIAVWDLRCMAAVVFSLNPSIGFGIGVHQIKFGENMGIVISLGTYEEFLWYAGGMGSCRPIATVISIDVGHP